MTLLQRRKLPLSITRVLYDTSVPTDFTHNTMIVLQVVSSR